MYVLFLKKMHFEWKEDCMKTAYNKNSPSFVSEYISQEEILLGNKTTELCCIDYVTQNMYCFTE